MGFWVRVGSHPADSALFCSTATVVRGHADRSWAMRGSDLAVNRLPACSRREETLTGIPVIPVLV